MNLSCFLAAVHVTSKTTDESFVNFNAAAKWLCKRSSLHSKSDSVDHEPRGFLRDADSSVDLVRTNSVFAVRNHPDNHQPLIQAERRILKDGAYLDRELSALMAALALPLLLLGKKRHISTATSRTDNAIRPSPRYQIAQAVIRIREVNDCLLQCFRVCFVRHDVRILAKFA
jgi:hypothetical protein